MNDIDRLTELIERIPEIEKCFYVGETGFFTSYDWKTRQKNTSSMQSEMIYKSPEFMKWRDEIIQVLSKVKQNQFTEEIIQLCQHFSGLGDRSRFDKLHSKLIVLKEHLAEYELDYSQELIDERVSENELSEKIFQAMSKLQRNHAYQASSSEDMMNDYIRDLLDVSFTVKDQTRQGDSPKGNDAGEIDIQICDDGLPLVMIEGVKLDSLRKEYLDQHIEKVLTIYDPNGCPYVFVLIYATVTRFSDFYNKMLEHLREYAFPYDRKTDIQDVETGYSELRHAQIVLARNEKIVRLHFYVVHIRESQ